MPPDSPTACEQLLTLVQALEHEGISTVLVEEAGSGDPSWLSLVVDIVFELAFHAAPDTGELGRKLVCRKSRYSLFDPGPHDRGTWKERLCVWPSSLRLAEAFGGNSVEPLPLAIPIAETNRWVRGPKGGLVLSAALAWRDAPALNAIRGTPGSRVIRVNAGATTTIAVGRTRTLVSDSEGPYAIAWSCAKLATTHHCNAVIIQGIEGLLDRASWRQRVVGLLAALGRLGLVVVVHGEIGRLYEALAAEALLTWEEPGASRFPARRASRFSAPRAWRPAERWLMPPEAVFFNVSAQLRASVGNKRTTLLACDSRIMLETLWKQPSTSTQPDKETLGLKGAYVRAMLGSSSATRTDNPQAANPGAARLAILDGDDWRAGRHVVMGFNDGNAAPEFALAWKCVCGSMAKNPAAIGALEGLLESEPVVLGSLLRGLGAIGSFERADKLIEEIAHRFQASSWLIERMKAEVRLESTDEPLRREAHDRLERLLDVPETPYLQRAELLHNLSVVEALLGDSVKASQRRVEAAAMNPYLAVAETPPEDVEGEGEDD